ncbi:hypothetical protein PM082_011352 [Marasmius tenuissimus]|nr:hypothetical protein PM082_011352 [Marasmius tenuissimus]
MSTSVSRLAIRAPSRAISLGVRSRIRHAHTATHGHLPFDASNSRAFTTKFLSYVGVGFALPFVAVYWGWHKPGGLKNPEGQWPEWMP